MRRSRLWGALLALAAAAICLWFAAMAVSNARAVRAAERLHGDPRMGAAQFQDDLGRLRAAEQFGLGSEWKLRQASYLLLRDRPRARALATSVAKTEPDNLTAWLLVLQTTADRRLRDRATLELERLRPRSSDR